MAAVAVTVPPHLSGSSRDLPERLRKRSRLPGVQRMEPIYGLQAIHVLGSLPRRAILPGPLDEVLELPSTAVLPGVKDSIHVLLLLAIHHHWGQRFGPLAGERIIGGVFQGRHVEHRMDPHGVR